MLIVELVILCVLFWGILTVLPKRIFSVILSFKIRFNTMLTG